MARVLCHGVLVRDPGLDARGYLCEAGISLGPVALVSLEDIVTEKKAQIA